ncbi:hypothetical protein QOT17_003416 [Balamuthia mandrillaris]
MLLALPVELLGLILDHIDTKELYPNCFLVCKTLLEALQQEQSWKRRCLRDLELSEDDPFLSGASTSWRQLYKNHSSICEWDPKHATLPIKQRSELTAALGLDSKNLYNGEGSTTLGVTIQADKPFEPRQRCKGGSGSTFKLYKGLARWEGLHSYVSTRTKQPLRAGSCYSLEFEICNHQGPHNFGVGFITDNWDCRLNAHVEATPKQSGWLWWSEAYCTHNISGLQLPADFAVEQTRHVTEEWKQGDVLGALVDLHPFATDRPFGHAVHFFKNSRWTESVALPLDVERLWPVVKLYDMGDTVELRRASTPFVLPPEKYPIIEKQLKASKLP